MEIEKSLHSVENNRSLDPMINQLLGLSEIYTKYNSLDDFIFQMGQAEKGMTPIEKKFEGLIQSCSRKIYKEFASREIYPSYNYICELLFGSLKTGEKAAKSIIAEILNGLQLSGVKSPSIVVYPVYSFGFENIGIGAKRETHLEIKDTRLYIQQNNIKGTFQCLEEMKNFLDLKDCSFDYDLINHYCRSRPLKWLHSNPLIISPVFFSSSDYYENEYWLIRHLEKEVSKLFLTYQLLSKNNEITNNTGFSTRQMNNFETRDIKHYLVFSLQDKILRPTCIPLHFHHNKILEISNICIDIPTSLRPEDAEQIDLLSSYIDKIYLDSNPFSHEPSKDFFDNIRRSIIFFIRSHQARQVEDKISLLTIGFEMLYGDDIKENIVQTLSTNLACLNGNSPNIPSLIKNLYNFRSGVVHTGTIREGNLESVLTQSQNLYYSSLIKTIQLIADGKLPIEERCFTNYSRQIFCEKVGFSPI